MLMTGLLDTIKVVAGYFTVALVYKLIHVLTKTFPPNMTHLLLTLLIESKHFLTTDSTSLGLS